MGGCPPQARIVLEERSLNTLQNAWEVLPLLPEECRRLLLVTSDFHMPRASYLFEAAVGCTQGQLPEFACRCEDLGSSTFAHKHRCNIFGCQKLSMVASRTSLAPRHEVDEMPRPLASSAQGGVGADNSTCRRPRASPRPVGQSGRAPWNSRSGTSVVSIGSTRR